MIPGLILVFSLVSIGVITGRYYTNAAETKMIVVGDDSLTPTSEKKTKYVMQQNKTKTSESIEGYRAQDTSELENIVSDLNKMVENEKIPNP